MSLKSAPFYWVECDAPECDERSPGWHDDVVAWQDEGQAVDYAHDTGWSVGDAGHYCPDHDPDEGGE